MTGRLAYAYVEFLFALEVMLFVSSALLHVSVIFGARRLCSEYGGMLLGGAVFVGTVVQAFTRRGRWMEQIKSCPEWMWKGALVLGVYGLCLGPLVNVFRPWTLSGSPIGADAVCICILYPVRSTDYLDRSEVVRKAVLSVIFVILSTLLFLAYRAGFLPSPRR